MPAFASNPWYLEVDPNELNTVRIKHEHGAPLLDGQVLLRVEDFAMTANTMTYAALGDSFGYWRLFPADPGWGRIPAWGHARVIESRSGECEVGRVLFGFLPMGSSVLMTVRRSSQGIKATDPHRVELNPVYNQYSLEAYACDDACAAKAVFHPLFILSFVLHHYLVESEWFGADEVVVISASSKTALGFAFLAKDDISCKGLTSPSHQKWLEATGAYDRVIQYGAGLRETRGNRVLIIDFSGNAALVKTITAELGNRMVWMVSVGYTHVARAATLKGDEDVARSEIFFGPDHIVRLVRIWGGAGFNTRFADALASFIDESHAWFQLRYADGIAEIGSAYKQLREGTLLASEILIARPNHGVRHEG
ncbi:MAG: DUF2855 family protein [Burkholderiaceae bacterium]|jgi:hypothetical protein